MNVDVSNLVNVGAVGVVLAWFMVRAERKLDELIRAVNRLAMAHAIDVATRDDAPVIVKTQAKAIMEEIKGEIKQPGSFIP